MNIRSVDIYSRKFELKAAYELSFATLHSFQSNFVRIITDKGIGLGECTALPGYASETFQAVDNELRRVRMSLFNKDYESAKQIVDKIYGNFPFAASAIGTALDFAFTDIPEPKEMVVPLTFTVSSYHPAEEVVRASEKGFRTVKIKIGKRMRDDIDFIERILSYDLDLMYRLDANQGYSLDKAKSFIEYLNSRNSKSIDYLEQPIAKHNWEGLRELCGNYPILLDESIYTASDIERAREIGALFIKLKLCKSKGFHDLVDRAKQASSLGLGVVLGNGVSTGIGNMAEAVAFYTYRDIFHGDFEGNGFAKVIDDSSPIDEEGGKLVCKGGN